MRIEYKTRTADCNGVGQETAQQLCQLPAASETADGRDMSASVLYRLWGKTNERDRNRPEGWTWRMHPAICHMVDVGYVAEAWLSADPGLLGRFCLLAPGIDRDELRRIIVTIVALHDLGKLHRSFQSKSDDGWRAGYAPYETETFQRDTACRGFDHGKATGIIMRDVLDKERKQWRSWRKGFDMAAGHHGKLYKESYLSNSNVTVILPFETEFPFIVECIEAIEKLFGMPQKVPKTPHATAFYMLLAGFTAVCDWFGSDSTIYEYAQCKGLPITCFDDIERYLNLLRKDDHKAAREQLRDAGLLGGFRREALSYERLFAFLRDHPLRPLQSVSRSIPFGQTPGGEIVVVEAPMGMGKTEIALYFAARAIGAGHADGVYFALPTQASSNALFGRITDFAEAVRDPEDQISVVLAHGGSRFAKKYRELQQRTYQRRKAYQKAVAGLGTYRDATTPPSEIVATAWLERSKQSLLASVGVGTIDQAMLGAMCAKHAFVRLFALANKVVVFDEIHAYDAYMNEVIFHLLRWLHALGAKVILLSATLPRSLRNNLLASYGCTPPETETLPEHDPYPQILYGRDGAVAAPFTVDPAESVDSRALNIHIRKIEVAGQDRTLKGAGIAVDLVRTGGCIAWIRNTVKEAQNAWSEVRAALASEGISDVDVRLIHARFTRTDRNDIEEELVEVLGPKAYETRPQKMIVIATQVIEQSVDIDFDAMISDLAPVDLLLQRLGRMWRHERPLSVRHGHTEPVLHVLTPDAEDLYDMRFGSSAFVYDPEILARTAALTNDGDRWSMPDSCRTLVAQLYDRDEFEWSAEAQKVGPSTLDKVRAKRRETNRIARDEAKKILMPEPDSEELEMRVAFNDDDKGERIELTTRQGHGSGTVVLLHMQNGAIEFGGKELPISPLPDKENFSALIDFDEAIILSSVSFPWWSALERPEFSVPELAALDQWWRDRRPYDNKAFLLLDPHGKAEHPQFDAYYTREQGLVIESKREKKSSADEDEIDYSVV